MTRLIAFYLPQYHPIPENDRWWGKGFTEWTNVTKARPLFPGHDQPRVPADLGYYDLRAEEVRVAQARLAQDYGIHGFCYYYYWFNGRRLLERPLDAMLASGVPDFPFCICWANENWSRRWDGSENEILMAQEHSPESDIRFIEDVIPILKDPRYIRVNGAPILLVYRISILPEAHETVARWRQAAAAAGLEKIHVAAVRSFGISDPRIYGCDSAVDFPPHGVVAREIQDEVEDLEPGFEGKIYDYRDLVPGEDMMPDTPYPLFPGVMTGWDNSARRGRRAHIFRHSTPELYQAWLEAAIERAERSAPPGEPMVFINAWNEWAEGTYLEPDRTFGHAWLKATRRALGERGGWRGLIEGLRRTAESRNLQIEDELGTLAARMEALEAANAYLRSNIDINALKRSLEVSDLEPGLPVPDFSWERPAPGLLSLEQVNSSSAPERVQVTAQDYIYVKGWSVPLSLRHAPAAGQSYVLLHEPKIKRTFCAVIEQRMSRPDVRDTFRELDQALTLQSGFEVMFNISGVPNGQYRLAVLERDADALSLTFARTLLEVRRPKALSSAA